MNIVNRAKTLRALERLAFVWPTKLVPFRHLLSVRWGNRLDIDAARQLVTFAPGHFRAQMEAGKAFLFGSEHKVSIIVDAEKCFRRAVAIRPRDSEATTYFAWSLDNQGRWSEAYEIYEHALRLNPSFRLAQERHALAKEQLNIIDASEKEITTKSERFSRFPETIDSLSDLDKSIWETVLSHISRGVISLSSETKIVTVGSCFAANLAHALQAEGITATNLTMGESINSSYANRELFEWALGKSDSVSEEMLKKFSRTELVSLLAEADVVIYTLGVAPCFFETKTGRFAMPQKREAVRGVISGKYVFRNTSVDENVTNLEAIISLIRRKNPECKFVFSLSPVPLTSTLEGRSSIEADCLSKATLRVAVEQIITTVSGCIYWPAFEIVRWIGAYVPGMYGEEDGTTHHVSERIVRLIMRAFLQAYQSRDGVR